MQNIVSTYLEIDTLSGLPFSAVQARSLCLLLRLHERT